MVIVPGGSPGRGNLTVQIFCQHRHRPSGTALCSAGPFIAGTCDIQMSPAVLLTEPGNKTDKILGLDEEAKLLLDNIGYRAVIIDSLVETTGLCIAKVSELLLKLELEGLIETYPDGSIARK